MTTIFEKLLYGIKIANDNVVIINAKMDQLLNALDASPSCEPETEPNNNTD